MNISGGSHNVLIVDDEQDVCFLIKAMLKARGIEADSCFDATSCLQRVPKSRPSHIILDINLPDGNGLEILRKLKMLEPNAKVYMHSAQDTEENRKLAKERGAHGFLKKPINSDQLMELFK